jgi:hypothetical protein
MKSFLTTILLVLSLLVLPLATAAWCAEQPSPPPLQLHQAPSAAPTTPQGEEIRDIKGPVPVADASRLLFSALIACVLLLIAALVFVYLKRRRKPPVPVTPPETIALAELDQARSLMAQPLVYAERISAILRQYIESRFQIHSTRQTTQEFFSCLKNSPTIGPIDLHDPAGNLQECMEQCDIAKFAHGLPNQERMLAMDQAVRTFIETARQQEIP